MIVQYRGMPFDWRKRTGTIALNPSIPWAIEVVGGRQPRGGRPDRARPRSFELTGGSERIQLELGRPHGEVPIRMTGGIKTIRLERPSGVPVRLAISAASDGRGRRPDAGHHGGEHVDRVARLVVDRRPLQLEVTGGTKTITIVERRRRRADACVAPTGAR